MNSFFKKSFSLLLTLCLMLLAFGLTVRVNAEVGETYKKVELADIDPTDVIIIVSTKDDKNYAMSNDNGTGKAPAAVSVTIEGKYITTTKANIQWNITKVNDNGNYNLTIYPSGKTTCLYCTNTNNGVRVGTSDNKIFTIDASGYLHNTATKRYLGVYSEQDWRCYENTTGNIKSQNFSFYKLSDKVNVTFDSNGGTPVDGITDVSKGGKIIAPAEPTKDGYVFQGWYNGITLWDFENDTVTSDLTLVAKWANETLNTFLKTFDTQAYMSMGYKYSVEKGDGAYSIVDDHSSLKAGDKIVIAAKGYDVALSNTQNDNNRGQATIVKSIDGSSIDVNPMSDVCVFTLKKGTIEGTWAFYDSNNEGGYLYAASSSKNYLKTKPDCDNNASWIITIDNNGVASIKAQGTYTRNVLKYNGSSSLFSCYSSGQEDVVLYKLSNTVNYSNVDFRIRCGIDKDIDTKVQTLGQEAVYGISVSTSEKSFKFASTSEFYQVEEGADGKAYVIIDLGDVLNNSSRIDVEFTVKAYVEIDGETYYSSQEKCYSLVDLVQTYLNDENTKDLMVTLRTIFEGFGKNFN